jgi:Stress responsive A/B Barrel Domain
MYIHAFAFRWAPGTTELQKKRVKAEILALQGKIPGLLETHVGINISPRGQGHEFGGVMKFTDKAALDAYFPHPIHTALGDWLMPLIEPLEMDFEAASSTTEYQG